VSTILPPNKKLQRAGNERTQLFFVFAVEFAQFSRARLIFEIPRGSWTVSETLRLKSQVFHACLIQRSV
jgi:hypothetical protein